MCLLLAVRMTPVPTAVDVPIVGKRCNRNSDVRVHVHATVHDVGGYAGSTAVTFVVVVVVVLSVTGTV